MFKELKTKIKDKKLIIFGEQHSIRENIEVLSRFFSEISKKEDFNLCLEIPIELQKRVSYFMNKGDNKFLNQIHFSDGRNTYIDLIKDIYTINEKQNKNIKIFCIAPNNVNNQEEAEKSIAKNILKLIKDKKTFAVIGSIHASKNKIKINNLDITPAGFFIAKELSNKFYKIRIAKKTKKIGKE